MKLKTFFNEELKLFSTYDTYRSIPSLVDGFKPSQRKVIYGVIKRGEGLGEIKVSQLANSVSEKTDYHHGELSLESTIVGLAQKYSGANNINLLEPEGQFGSRLSPINAATRYIFTMLSKNFRNIFKKDDDIILESLYSDDQQIEPKFYYPILPMVLINGAEGIGTGFATSILNYNPKELKSRVLDILNGKNSKKELLPWYNGFTGNIFRNDNSQVVIEGKYEITNTTTIKITELPIGMYQDKYKKHLIKLQDRGFIKDFDDNSNDDKWEFIIDVPRSTTKLTHDELMVMFKLISRSTENYTLWNENGNIKVYKDVKEIVEDFVAFRLLKYEERRIKLIECYKENLIWLKEKYTFIVFYLRNHMKFAKKNKKELFALLEKENFKQIDRLLKLPIYTLTRDEIEKLKTQISDVKQKIKDLKGTNNKEMYIKELKELKF